MKKTSKNKPKIDSLRSLRKQKLKIQRKIEKCEVEIAENYYDLLHPFTVQNAASFASNDYDDLPVSVSKLYKLVLNVKRLSEIVKTGRAIYMDFRK